MEMKRDTEKRIRNEKNSNEIHENETRHGKTNKKKSSNEIHENETRYGKTDKI
jgi:hypothetical protein